MKRQVLLHQRNAKLVRPSPMWHSICRS